MSFSLFPIFEPGRKHIRYSAFALFKFLYACTLERNVNQATFMASSQRFWWRYFNLKHARYEDLDMTNEGNIGIKPHNACYCFPPKRQIWIKKTLVCFGNGTLESEVSYRRILNPATVQPQKAFYRRRNKCEVIKVDEFRIFRRCSMDLQMPPSLPNMAPGEDWRRRCHGHRFLVCQNCRTMWNRDRNAGRNIVLIAMSCMNYRSSMKWLHQIVGITGHRSTVVVIDRIPKGVCESFILKFA
ncbi:hypothetical protein ABEB36_002762 [Hypothenemus hampei]|uniref:Uncharacterized protein n=1 Tax=Hypothenemus hampei TaxID=57062 RepID=A0ABD1F6X4_HYPHA